MRRLLVYILMVSGSVLPHFTRGENNCPDEYVYTQQPPLDTVCNPYRLGILQLDCAVVGPGVSEIRWYFSNTNMDPNNEDTNLLTNSSKYTLLPYNMDKISGIQLAVHDLNEENDSGYFWCQGFVSDGSLSISAVLELLPLSSYPQEAPVCRQVVRNSVPTCASLMALPPEVSTTLILTTSKPSLPPVTTVSNAPTNTPSFMITDPLLVSTTVASSTQSTEETMSSFFEMSEFVLYVVLGLVTCLVIICICLAVVIIVLCKKRCQGLSNQQGSESKEMGFDHISNRTDFTLISCKRSSPLNSPYQPEVSFSSSHRHTNTQNRELSGDYAEIGPALIMNSDGLHHLHSYPGSTDAPPLPFPRSFANRLITENDPDSMSGYENPYDLPIGPANKPHDQTDSQVHGYNVLERTIPSEELSTLQDRPEIDPVSNIDDSLSDRSVVSPSSNFGQEEELYELSNHLQVQSQPLDTAQERPTLRLETIPEHPYHVLELEDEQEAAIRLTTTLENSQSFQTDSDPLATENDDDYSSDDRRYDRLVDPPHLYHVLQHSPSLNKPRVHEYQFSDYNHLQRGGSPVKDDQIMHIQLANPQSPTDVSMQTDSQSYESSLNDHDMFDDPQYLLSQVAKRKTASANVCPNLQKESHLFIHGRPPGGLQEEFPGCSIQVEHRKDRVESEQETDISKYCGDYERDPSYMQQLHSASPKRSSFQISRDSTCSQDDSGYATYLLQAQANDIKSPSPLLDTPHVYQPLQPKTMDPPCSPYEKIKKQSSSPT